MAHLLVIAAHADDLEFFCGGTVCKSIRQGHTADLIIATDGSRGTGEMNLDPVTLAEQRDEESRNAARIIGLREVICLGYSDGFLRDVPINTLRERLIGEIRARRPEVILTFDPADATDGHPDHHYTAVAASEAARFARLPQYHPEHSARGLPPHNAREVYYFARTPQAADKVVDVSEHLETQIAALQAHASQMRFLATQMIAEAQALGAPTDVVNELKSVDVIAESIRRRAAALGTPHGLKAAEVFRRERSFVMSLLRPNSWQPQDVL